MESHPTPERPREDLTPTLVARLRAGDDTAGALLDQLYRPALQRFCAGYLGTAEEARDLVQDVFCRALASESVPDNFRAWLYRIARNRCLDVLKGRVRRRDDQPMPLDPPAAAGITGRLTHLVRREQQEHLQRLVAGLPAAQREILHLRYAEGLSRKEIAEVLEIPESVVKSRLFEGLERLRQHSSLRLEP